jgi:hypothetical protein
MATQFRGLNRLDELQRRPFGSTAATRPTSTEGQVNSSEGGQYRQRAENYNLANRILKRQARRGDSRSALALLDVQREANEEGFSPGGIRRRNEFNSGLLRNLDARQQAAMDNERAAELKRLQTEEEIQKRRSAPQSEGVGATVMPESRNTAALDILEGQRTGDDTILQRGLDSANRLGVQQPENILRKDQDLTARRTLDDALGKSSSEAEIAQLKDRAARLGVSGSAFDRRRQWWERNRV